MIDAKRCEKLEKEVKRREQPTRNRKKTEKMKQIEKEHLSVSAQKVANKIEKDKKKTKRQTKKLDAIEEAPQQPTIASMNTTKTRSEFMASPAHHNFQPRLTSEEELQELAKARSKGNDYFMQLLRAQGWHC